MQQQEQPRRWPTRRQVRWTLGTVAVVTVAILISCDALPRGRTLLITLDRLLGDPRASAGASSAFTPPPCWAGWRLCFQRFVG
jgi:hypothetical protein